MTAPIDYNAVLADLLAKRGQIDAAIAVIRGFIKGSGSGASMDALASFRPHIVGNDGRSLIDAARR